MGLHSSLLERIGWVWLGEAWIWLALQQCPEVVWKCGCIHRSLCVSGQGCCVVCLCDGRETTVGCLGNKSFPWPTFLHVFYHISLSLSSSLSASLFPSLFLSWSLYFCLPSQSSPGSTVRFCRGRPCLMAFPFWDGGNKCECKHPLLGVKNG